MPFDILICSFSFSFFSFSFLPPTHRGPTLESRMLMKKNGCLTVACTIFFKPPLWERSLISTFFVKEVTAATARPLSLSVTLGRVGSSDGVPPSSLHLNSFLSHLNDVLESPFRQNGLYKLFLTHGYLFRSALSSLFFPPASGMGQVL